MGDKSYLQLKVTYRRLFPGNVKSEYEDLFFSIDELFGEEGKVLFSFDLSINTQLAGLPVL